LELLGQIFNFDSSAFFQLLQLDLGVSKCHCVEGVGCSLWSQLGDNNK
jgi:hypothetical protein